MSEIKRQVVDELHKPARRIFKRRKFILKGIDDLWQADLIELGEYSKDNKGYKFVLTVIDCFSKFAWARPILSKSSSDVCNAFENILNTGRKPKNLHTDQGKEFYNATFKKLVKKYNINHYSTYSNIKASIVERFNRTLKSSLWKEFSYQGSYDWLSCLQKLIEKYNNKTHRTTKMPPSKVVGRVIERKLLKEVYSSKKVKRGKPKFKIGDKVRISKYKAQFSKGYTPSWSTEIFTVNKVKHTCPVTYILKDETGQEIAGGFYEQEMQSVKYPDVYLVEKVLKRKGDRALVKWLGFDRATWEDVKNINI